MGQTVAKVVALVERMHHLGIKLYVWYHIPSLFLNIWYGMYKEHGENDIAITLGHEKYITIIHSENHVSNRIVMAI